MAAALVYLLARLFCGERFPLRNDIEIRRNLEQRIERQRARFTDDFFHRQDAHEMIANPEMIPLGFNIRVDDLVVEKLGVLRVTFDAPAIVIQEAAKEPELAALVQHLDTHEIA